MIMVERFEGTVVADSPPIPASPTSAPSLALICPDGMGSGRH